MLESQSKAQKTQTRA